MTSMSPNGLVSLSVAAKHAGVHPRTLRRWIAAGELTAYRVGPRLLKISLDELDEYIQKGRM